MENAYESILRAQHRRNVEYNAHYVPLRYPGYRSSGPVALPPTCLLASSSAQGEAHAAAAVREAVAWRRRRASATVTLGHRRRPSVTNSDEVEHDDNAFDDGPICETLKAMEVGALAAEISDATLRVETHKLQVDALDSWAAGAGAPLVEPSERRRRASISPGNIPMPSSQPTRNESGGDPPPHTSASPPQEPELFFPPSSTGASTGSLSLHWVTPVMRSIILEVLRINRSDFSRTSGVYERLVARCSSKAMQQFLLDAFWWVFLDFFSEVDFSAADGAFQAAKRRRAEEEAHEQRARERDQPALNNGFKSGPSGRPRLSEASMERSFLRVSSAPSAVVDSSSFVGGGGTACTLGPRSGSQAGLSSASGGFIPPLQLDEVTANGGILAAVMLHVTPNSVSAGREQQLHLEAELLRRVVSIASVSAVVTSSSLDRRPDETDKVRPGEVGHFASPRGQAGSRSEGRRAHRGHQDGNTQKGAGVKLAPSDRYDAALHATDELDMTTAETRAAAAALRAATQAVLGASDHRGGTAGGDAATEEEQRRLLGTVTVDDIAGIDEASAYALNDHVPFNAPVVPVHETDRDGEDDDNDNDIPEATATRQFSRQALSSSSAANAGLAASGPQPLAALRPAVTHGPQPQYLPLGHGYSSAPHIQVPGVRRLPRHMRDAELQHGGGGRDRSPPGEARRGPGDWCRGGVVPRRTAADLAVNVGAPAAANMHELTASLSLRQPSHGNGGRSAGDNNSRAYRSPSVVSILPPTNDDEGSTARVDHLNHGHNPLSVIIRESAASGCEEVNTTAPNLAQLPDAERRASVAREQHLLFTRMARNFTMTMLPQTRELIHTRAVTTAIQAAKGAEEGYVRHLPVILAQVLCVCFHFAFSPFTLSLRSRLLDATFQQQLFRLLSLWTGGIERSGGDPTHWRCNHFLGNGIFDGDYAVELFWLAEGRRRREVRMRDASLQRRRREADASQRREEAKQKAAAANNGWAPTASSVTREPVAPSDQSPHSSAHRLSIAKRSSTVGVDDDADDGMELTQSIGRRRTTLAFGQGPSSIATAYKGTAQHAAVTPPPLCGGTSLEDTVSGRGAPNVLPPPAPSSVVKKKPSVAFGGEEASDGTTPHSASAPAAVQNDVQMLRLELGRMRAANYFGASGAGVAAIIAGSLPASSARGLGGGGSRAPLSPGGAKPARAPHPPPALATSPSGAQQQLDGPRLNLSLSLSMQEFTDDLDKRRRDISGVFAAQHDESGGGGGQHKNVSRGEKSATAHGDGGGKKTDDSATETDSDDSGMEDLIGFHPSPRKRPRRGSNRANDIFPSLSNNGGGAGTARTSRPDRAAAGLQQLGPAPGVFTKLSQLPSFGASGSTARINAARRRALHGVVAPFDSSAGRTGRTALAVKAELDSRYKIPAWYSSPSQRVERNRAGPPHAHVLLDVSPLLQRWVQVIGAPSDGDDTTTMTISSAIAATNVAPDATLQDGRDRDAKSCNSQYQSPSPRRPRPPVINRDLDPNLEQQGCGNSTVGLRTDTHHSPRPPPARSPHAAAGRGSRMDDGSPSGGRMRLPRATAARTLDAMRWTIVDPSVVA